MKKSFLWVMATVAVAVVSVAMFVSAGKTPAILKIDFTAQVIEHQPESFSLDVSSLSSFSLSGNEPLSLLSYVRAIDEAAQDPAIKAIYMTPGNISAGLAQMEEIRAALKRFRDSGKPIISYSTDFGNVTAYMASVATKVIVEPSAESFLNGITSTPYFLKDLADKLGIQVQLIRHGKYKSAGETYTKNDLTPENREQIESLMNSIWQSRGGEIAASRGMSLSELDRIINSMELVTASDLVRCGLVDTLCYKDELEDYICRQFEFKDIDFAKHVDVVKYASKVQKKNKKGKNRIAVLYAEGEVVLEGTPNDVVGGSVAAELRKLRKDGGVKAVVLRVNSPGGSVQASEIIRREVELLNRVKPVIVSFGEYAASGGYWISATSDQIFTDCSTVTGSIGVFAMIPSFGNALKSKLGINVVPVSTHKHGGAHGVVPLTDEEVMMFQKSVEHIYGQFTTIVAEGRGMTREGVDSIGQGRVWSGAAALQNGLADKRGGLTDALNYAAQRVGVQDYRVEEYPVVKSTFEMLFGKDSGGDGLLGNVQSECELLHIEGAEPFFGSLKMLDKPAHFARMAEFLVWE